MYAPPAQTNFNAPPQAPAPSYGYSAPPKDTIENTNPFSTSNNSAYTPYGGYGAEPQTNKVTTFGVSKAMRTENNIGADGSERSSVKVHHPPGGGGSLNIFGASHEDAYQKPSHAPQSYEPPQEPSYNKPAAYGYQEPSGYAPQAPTGYAPQEPTGYAPQEPTGYAPQEPTGYAPQEPAGFNQAPSYPQYPPQEEAKQTFQDPNVPPGFTASSSYTQPQAIVPSDINISSQQTTFGGRVESGNNSGPTTDKSSIRVHAPPGGKSSIFF